MDYSGFPGKAMGEKRDVSDHDMQELVDGGLGEERKEAVLSAIIRSPDLLARYHELLKQKDILKNWWHSFKKEN